jgi:hypothetical protein
MEAFLVKRTNKRIEPASTLDRAVEMAAPLTPSAAPHTVNPWPLTVISRVGKIKRKLPMTLAMLAVILAIIGDFVSPALRRRLAMNMKAMVNGNESAM